MQCKMCNSKEADFIEELNICKPCMIEYCTSTNCFGYQVGKYPICKYLEIKKTNADKL